MTTRIAVYRPGTTLLHRLPVGPKLAGLVLLSIAIVVVHGVPSAVAALVGASVIAAVARLDARSTWRSLRTVLLLALIAALLQWWWTSLPRATETLLDLLSLGLLGLSLSVTTAATDMVDAIVRWLRPSRRLGLDPDRVALTISLAIQSLPATLQLATETRDAARARGLRTPRAWLTPFVIRVVARAHETGDALRARGVAD
ncbi:energy-coupling factor transporter transmembrane component T family protein [Nocardioides sp. Kera G14]|uniref:energy-coupling factor transporter transmembrane component T family protein n=1 Tax=Nocardioides sp. Kera G14 TaxID=2884264 RepID=UPI001D0F98F7|nr:energy-coupling factor transporter transmembrane protein EcfT [Nocardioides sp. Kera G14]UDY22710.1 energy-coupling factor transporter transmembrane protein EcfT [Nocardioides sp. Kera G14]